MHNSEFAVVRKKLHCEHLFHLVRWKLADDY